MNKVRYDIVENDAASEIIIEKTVSLAAVGLFFRIRCASKKADALEEAEATEPELFNELLDVGLVVYK